MNIGTVTINSKLALAPMAGVSDQAFRIICRELGCGYTVTEMISAKALCYQDKKTLPLMELGPEEHPGGVQIFGSDPICMAEAAQIAMGQVLGRIHDVKPAAQIIQDMMDELYAMHRRVSNML